MSRKRRSSDNHATQSRKRRKRTAVHAHSGQVEEQKNVGATGKIPIPLLKIRSFHVSRSLQVGGFWSRAHNAVPSNDGSLELRRQQKVGSLRARMMSHEFLSACHRLRCTVNPTMLSRVLGGGRRSPQWCELMLRTMVTTTEESIRKKPKWMLPGTKMSAFQTEMKEIVPVTENATDSLGDENEGHEAGNEPEADQLEKVDKAGIVPQKLPSKNSTNLKNDCDYPCESDDEEKKYQSSAIPMEDMLQPASTRRYIESVTNGAAWTLGQFITICRSKTPVSFDDWNPGVKPLDTKPPAHDREWWEKPHFCAVQPSGVKHSANIARRWREPLSEKVAARCALIRTNVLLDSLFLEACEQAQTKREIPTLPVLSLSPHAVHFLATETGRFAIRVLKLAAHHACAQIFAEGDASQFITKADIDFAAERVISLGGIAKSEELLYHGTPPWESDGVREMAKKWKPAVMSECKSLLLCSCFPQSTIKFPKVINDELEAAKRLLSRVANGEFSLSGPLKDRAEKVSPSVSNLNDVPPVVEQKSNVCDTPFPMYETFPPVRSIADDDSVEVTDETADNTALAVSSRCSDGTSRNIEVPLNPFDVQNVLRSEKPDPSGSIVCYYRLALLCLYFMGIAVDLDAYNLPPIPGDMNASRFPARTEKMQSGSKGSESPAISEPDIETEFKAYSEVDSGTESAAELEGDGRSGSETEPQAETAVEPQAETQAEPQAEPQLKEQAESQATTAQGEAQPGEAESIAKIDRDTDVANVYAKVCDFTSFGSALVPGVTVISKEAMDRLATVTDAFARQEASVLSACAGHDDGRPWIDRADVLLVCSIRKEAVPPEFT